MPSLLLQVFTGPSVPAAAAGVSDVDNLAAVDAKVWRGAAPGSPAAYRSLAAAGVTTVVDLRAERQLPIDADIARSYGLTLVSLPIRDGQIPTCQQIAEFLEVVETSPGTVFLHCGAGVGAPAAWPPPTSSLTSQASGVQATMRNLSVLLQSERTDLLRQVMGVAPNDRSERLAAAAELRSGLGAVAGATSTLLGIGLLGRGGNLAAHLGLVGAGLTLGELPANHALQDVGARLKPENVIGKRDRAVRLAVEGGDLQVHHSAPFSSVAGAASQPEPERRRLPTCGSRPASAHPSAARA